MKETVIRISDGLHINSEYVDCDPFISVEKTGTLIKVSTTIYVDEQNFHIDKRVADTGLHIMFEQGEADNVG